MKEIDYLPIDFTRKCNLAEIAKKYEGRDVYLMLKSDSWNDTYVAVMEEEFSVASNFVKSTANILAEKYDSN
jgi:hypothetical protein